jgi:uncharacterized damage-inducible protein DinB
MYTSVEGFVKDYEHECGETQKVFGALTDKSLAQSVANDHRTLGRISWHIVTTYPEMCEHAGITFSGIGKDDPLPKTAAEIAAAYQKITQQLIEYIQKNWKDATLAEVKNFYGIDWPLGLALQILVRHEIHHRGQMTVLMRQAGLNVPGVYGPSRDEWTTIGMQPPTV